MPPLCCYAHYTGFASYVNRNVVILRFFQENSLQNGKKVYIICGKGAMRMASRNLYEVHRYTDVQFPIFFHTDYLQSRNERPPLPDVHMFHDSCGANWHEALEILRFLSGRATVLIDGEPYLAKAGDLVVINSNCLHNVLATDGSCLYDCLIIGCELCQEWGFPIAQTEFAAQFTDRQLHRCVGDISQELSEKRPHYKTVVIAKCIEILAQLSRRHTVAADRSAAGKRPTRIREVLRYITQNFDQPLTLRELGERFGYDRYYLAHSFVELTGVPPMEYLQQVRLRAARRLLASSDRSVAEIAAACGYASASAFGAAFRRHSGQTPMEYRREKRHP